MTYLLYPLVIYAALIAAIFAAASYTLCAHPPSEPGRAGGRLSCSGGWILHQLPGHGESDKLHPFRAAVLAEAEREGWSVRDLKAQVRQRKNRILAAPSSETCTASDLRIESRMNCEGY